MATQTFLTSNQVGWLTGYTETHLFRFYIMDASSSTQAAALGLTQPTMAELSMSLRDDDTMSGGTSSEARVCSQDRWVPHTLAYRNNLSSGPRILLRTFAGPPGHPGNESYFYLACDVAKEGQTCLGYTLPPEETGTDERLTITGFGLEASFTLLMAGLMPDDDWQHLTPRPNLYWPMFTLWSDSNNWIEFGAYASGHTTGSPPNEVHIEDGRFCIQYKANGGSVQTFYWPRRTSDGTLIEDIYWSRNSQLLVGFSYDATSHRLTVCASLGGDAPRAGSRPAGQDLPTPVFSNGFNFDTLKFRGHSEEVVSMRWFGGKAFSNSAMSFEDMADYLADLSFL